MSFTILSDVSTWINLVTEFIITTFNLNSNLGKFIGFIIILFIIHISLKVIKEPVKWLLLALSIILAIQIGLSFIPLS